MLAGWPRSHFLQLDQHDIVARHIVDFVGQGI
jgi:hypothetical protein